MNSFLYSYSGVMKCKKDKAHRLCPVCASPRHLNGKQISESEGFQCTGPVISDSPGKDVSHKDTVSELLSLEDFEPPFGNITLNLSDEHGNSVDLSCRVVKPKESEEIMWDYTESSQISANMSLLFDLECPVDKGKYTSLWRLLGYYSEVALHLRREIMLSKEPKLSYRYRQDIERDVYYYTGVRANILSYPSWLMQSYVNMQLNRPFSTSKSVRLIFTTQMSSTTDSEQARGQKRSWVMIKHSNATRTTFSSVVGSMIEMDCSVISSGGPRIRWMFPDGSKVRAPFSSPNNRLFVSSTGKLLIKGVDHSDSGVYYCMSEVLGDVDFLPFRLSVVESSRPSLHEKVKIALEKFPGEPVYLPCKTTASPDADVNWIFPDSSVMNAKSNSSRGFIFSNGTLFIPRCRPEDNGNYKCVVLNQHGEETLSATLTVKRRQGTEPLRQYATGPQSAAGVSTKVKAIFEDIDESSGDDSDWKRMPPNSGFINQRGGSQPRSRAIPVRNMQRHFLGHRKPIKKGFNGQRRKDVLGKRTKINKSNNRIDPQRWADLLSKIHEKAISNTTTTSSYPSTLLERVQTVNQESHNSIEGSSLDDGSSLEKEPNSIIMSQTHTAQSVMPPPHTDNQLPQIAPPESGIKSNEVTWGPVKTTAAPNYVTIEVNILEENHVNALNTSASHREERQQNQLEKFPVAPNAEFRNERGISVKLPDVEKSYTSKNKNAQQMISTSMQTNELLSANIMKQRTLSRSHSRTPWNPRRRFGSRGRINPFRLRPSLPLITSRPQLFTTPKVTKMHNPSITTITSATVTAGTSGYSTTSSQYQKSLTDSDHDASDQTNISLLADTIIPLVHKLKDSDLSTIQRTETMSKCLHHTLHSTPPAVTVAPSQRRSNKDTSKGSWQNMQTATTEDEMNYRVASASSQEADYETPAASQEGFTTQISSLEPSWKSVTEDYTAHISPVFEVLLEKSLSSLQVLKSTHKSVQSATAPVKSLQTPAIFSYEETRTEDLLKKSFSGFSVKQNQAGFLTTTLHTTLHDYGSVFPITTAGPGVRDEEPLLSNISKPSGIISTVMPQITTAKVHISTKSTATSMTPSIKITPSFNTPIISTNFGETTLLKPNVSIAFYSRHPATNRIHDKNYGSTHNSEYPNHRQKFNIYQTPSDRNSSVHVRAGSDRSSVSPKSFTTPTQATVTWPTLPAKPRNRIQTDLGENVALPQPPYISVPRARPRITTANLTTLTVNAETDVQFPCNSVGDPKPFLTWSKVSTGKHMSNILYYFINSKQTNCTI